MTNELMTDDLMFQDDIHEVVSTAYSAITTGAGRSMAQRFYSDEELASLPGGALDWALGVGNPVRHAGLSEGETVLDIGSGAAESGRPTRMFLTKEAVRLALDGVAVGIACDGY